MITFISTKAGVLYISLTVYILQWHTDHCYFDEAITRKYPSIIWSRGVGVDFWGKGDLRWYVNKYIYRWLVILEWLDKGKKTSCLAKTLTWTNLRYICTFSYLSCDSCLAITLLWKLSKLCNIYQLLSSLHIIKLHKVCSSKADDSQYNKMGEKINHCPKLHTLRSLELLSVR